MVFLSEVGEVMVVRYHECVNLCETNIETRMMIYFGCKVLQVVLYLVSV
jgi:hypothetical protein